MSEVDNRSSEPVTKELVACYRHVWGDPIEQRMVEKRSNMTSKYFALQRKYKCRRCGIKKWRDA